MSKCAPFEDYEYNIFGHDRCWIVLTDFLSLLAWSLCLYRLPSIGLRDFFLTVSIPILPLIPVRVIKTLHTLVDPEGVEDSTFFCWSLYIEYSLHYLLGITFLSSALLFLGLIINRRSTVFPGEKVHWILYTLLLLEAIFRTILMMYFDLTLNFWPSTYHLIVQSICFVLFTLLWIVSPFFACGRLRYKEGSGGFSVGWIFVYFIIAWMLCLYQTGISAFLILPRLHIAGYDVTEQQQTEFWHSVEAYISHKFSFTPMGIICPAFFLLPPVRAAIHPQTWRIFQRRDAISP